MSICIFQYKVIEPPDSPLPPVPGSQSSLSPPATSHYSCLEFRVVPDFNRTKKRWLHTLSTPNRAPLKQEGAQHLFILKTYTEYLLCSRHISRHQNSPVNTAEKRFLKNHPATMEIIFYQRDIMFIIISPLTFLQEKPIHPGAQR